MDRRQCPSDLALVVTRDGLSDKSTIYMPSLILAVKICDFPIINYEGNLDKNMLILENYIRIWQTNSDQFFPPRHLCVSFFFLGKLIIQLPTSFLDFSCFQVKGYTRFTCSLRTCVSSRIIICII